MILKSNPDLGTEFSYSLQLKLLQHRRMQDAKDPNHTFPTPDPQMNRRRMPGEESFICRNTPQSSAVMSHYC